MTDRNVAIDLEFPHSDTGGRTMAVIARKSAEDVYEHIWASRPIPVVPHWWFRLRTMFYAGMAYGGLGERLAERERIARELHDTLLQGVQGLLLQTGSALEVLPAQDSSRRALEHALERTEKLLSEARARIKELRGDSQGSRTLIQAVALEAREIAPSYKGVYSVSANGNPQKLHPVVFDEVLLIAREAHANAFLHAGASRVETEVRYTKTALQVSVRDNGQGFDPPHGVSKRWQQHWGLLGMHERARKLGGRVTIHSKRSLGTQIELSVPATVAYQPRR